MGEMTHNHLSGNINLSSSWQIKCVKTPRIKVKAKTVLILPKSAINCYQLKTSTLASCWKNSSKKLQRQKYTTVLRLISNLSRKTTIQTKKLMLTLMTTESKEMAPVETLSSTTMSSVTRATPFPQVPNTTPKTDTSADWTLKSPPQHKKYTKKMLSRRLNQVNNLITMLWKMTTNYFWDSSKLIRSWASKIF